MKKVFRFLALASIAVFAFTACSHESEVMPVSEEIAAESMEWTNGQVIPGQYIVIFKESGISQSNLKSAASYDERIDVMRKEVNAFLGEMSMQKSSSDIQQVYAHSVYGFSMKASAVEIEAIKNSDKVAIVEPDRMMVLAKPAPQPDPTTPAQVVPWGVTRVNGGVDATGKVAWIIDTGVDFDHPDLNVNVTKSKTFVRSKTADDDNGHGSHCAGTIAAKNNTVGVVGVAANATCVAVKVLDRSGSGAYSGVISGIDYVAANGKSGDVANMSLGGPVSDAIDLAVANAAASSGVVFALAAGNETDDANNHSPARVNGPNVYTISAMDNADKFAYFSNYGNPPVDFCEPGVSIYSTYKSGGYATLSGTSMATPHFAGLVLIGAIKNGGYVLNDPDGNPDVIGVH